MNSVIKHKKYLLKCFDEHGKVASFDLARLYGVSLYSCSVAGNKDSYDFYLRTHRGYDLVLLDIRRDGKYSEHFELVTKVKEIFTSLGD